MYELQKYKVHITCSRNHWGWGYNNVFRKYAKTCIRENEGKNKIYCNCHSGWEKSSRESIRGNLSGKRYS